MKWTLENFQGYPTKDKSPQKPPKRSKVFVQDIIPPPEYTDYMAMSNAVMAVPKSPLPEIRCMLTEKRKDGLPA